MCSLGWTHMKNRLKIGRGRISDISLLWLSLSSNTWLDYLLCFQLSIRRGTISRSRNNTMRSRRDTASDQAKYNQKLISKTLDLSQIRLEMMKTGEYRTGARNSLDRISTTQGLPGLTQAETLLSYHTRQSINFDRA